MKYTQLTFGETESARDKRIVKSNDLIQKSRFSLTTQQQKIVLFIISQISPFDKDFALYEFKITEFCKVCGIEPKGDMYTYLKNQIKKISDKSLWIELENGEETLLRWIEKPYINKRTGTIQIKLDDDMKPYLLQLKEKFTAYDFIYTLNFKSKYSIRLYEYLKSIHYKKLETYWKTIEINEFQKLLDSTYKDFKNFNTWVLKPAHKEINAFSDIYFNYELIKDGNKVTHIRLCVDTKPQMECMKAAAEVERLLDERN